MDYKILAVGDVVGTPGVDFLRRTLPELRRRLDADFCIVNGENAAMVGLTPRQAEAIRDAGADVITLGNHTWKCREIVPYLDDCSVILRPANYPSELPGRGWGVFTTARGREVAVVNLLGRLNMPVGPDDPFRKMDMILQKLGKTPVFLDFHAEATSEKQAMGWYLDGRVGAVFGTHTHVPTADARVLPRGTGYVTDLGMTGARDSALGIRPEQSIALFRGELASRFEAAEGPRMLHAVLFTMDGETELCRKAERVDVYD
ncbi:MAG: TIGR00282 family metallophosphoesterase [Oscillospiraceae bacterium]|nr:TIGR00282 family metallophosphoesterase [Oscillospiraceae bacterium]